MIGRIVSIVVIALVLVVSVGSNVSSQQTPSQLHQTVKPIECVYTQVSSGSGLETSSDCADHIAPTLEEVLVSPGVQPVLVGRYNPLETRSLRIWLGGAWYTLGVSPYLSQDEGEWRLDLLPKSTPLVAGTYTVVIETLTYDNFQLSSIYTNALIIPPAPQTNAPTLDGDGKNSPVRSPYPYNQTVIFPLEQFELPAVHPLPNAYSTDFSHQNDVKSSGLFVILQWSIPILGGTATILTLFFIVKRQKGKKNERDT